MMANGSFARAVDTHASHSRVPGERSEIRDTRATHVAPDASTLSAAGTLEDRAQPLRRHRQPGNRARHSDGIVDSRGDRRADSIDAALPGAFQPEGIER